MTQLQISHKPPQYWEKKHGRTANLTGTVVNNFEITGYVGSDWKTSQCVRFKHIPCGSTGTVLAREAKFRLGKRKCATCKKAAQSTLTPKAYASDHNHTT
jgi:hypothetical protein